MIAITETLINKINKSLVKARTYCNEQYDPITITAQDVVKKINSMYKEEIPIDNVVIKGYVFILTQKIEKNDIVQKYGDQMHHELSKEVKMIVQQARVSLIETTYECYFSLRENRNKAICEPPSIKRIK